MTPLARTASIDGGEIRVSASVEIFRINDPAAPDINPSSELD